MASCRGLAWKAAWGNKHIKQRLRHMGLSPVNIFGCLFDYLYRPTPATISLVQPLLPQLLDPTTFKVGLQIRTGDEHLGGGKQAKQFEDAFEWFHCAKVVEQHWKPPGQKSVWFLLTDSPDIRHGTVKYLGGQAVTMRDALLAHTLHNIPSGANASAASSILGFAAAETWLISLMDAHVISQLSGFGRMGAMMSGSWGHVVQLPAGMWSLHGYEANLTYIARRPGGNVVPLQAAAPGALIADGSMRGTSGRRLAGAMLGTTQCKNPSQAVGPAFCWSEDPPGPLQLLDGKSPMSLKIRHMCSKATPIEEVVAAHTDVRRS
jgi:hypothetical protein